MILYKLLTVNGEDEYEWYGYYNTFTEKDYQEGKITDKTILSEHHDNVFEDEDLEDKNDQSYWYGEKVVSVTGVWDTTEEELLVLHKFGIVYYTQGGQQ